MSEARPGSEAELKDIVSQLDGCNDSNDVLAALCALRAFLQTPSTAPPLLTQDACGRVRDALTAACMEARQRLGGPEVWAPCAAVFGECLTALLQLASRADHLSTPAPEVVEGLDEGSPPAVPSEHFGSATSASAPSLPWAGVTVGLAVAQLHGAEAAHAYSAGPAGAGGGGASPVLLESITASDVAPKATTSLQALRGALATAVPSAPPFDAETTRVADRSVAVDVHALTEDCADGVKQGAGGGGGVASLSALRAALAALPTASAPPPDVESAGTAGSVADEAVSSRCTVAVLWAASCCECYLWLR